MLFNAVFLPEFLNPAFRIHNLLLSRKEGVAAGTDLNLQLLLRRPSLNHAPTGAGDGRRLILRVNLVLHFCILS